MRARPTRSQQFWGVVAVLLSAPFLTANQAHASPDPILINDVRPWDGAGSVGDSVNILIVGGLIDTVTVSRLEAEPGTIVIDGGGRMVMGKIEVGEAANLLVIDGDPPDDVTQLVNPSSWFLVVKNGIIQEGVSAARSTPAAKDPKYNVVDPLRFKVVALPTKPWYVYGGKGFSIGLGAAVLLDRTEFNQGINSRDQLGDLEEFNSGEVRALRIGVAGHFPVSGRRLKFSLVGATRAFDRGFDTNTTQHWTWYDWAIGIPVFGGAELKIGKQKENISHDRLTLLVDQRFMERAAVLDALLPSRNTGVTLANVALDGRMTWSVGAFTDMFDDRDEPFEESNQLIARISGLPFVSRDGARLLHTGIGIRYSDVDSGVLRFRTSPEVFFSPDFVDTGEFFARDATWLSLECAWRQGPFWLSGEYVGTRVSSPDNGDPVFKGFHLTGSWSVTGERRGYDRRRGVFKRLAPDRIVTGGGTGAWEIAARYSAVDLSDALIEGGDMIRVSLGVNWYATSSFKATMQYGWIGLDRFGIRSTTRVFQLRAAFLLGL